MSAASNTECWDCGADIKRCKVFNGGWVCMDCAMRSADVYLHANRLRSACEAMSRFLVWVWMEMEVQWGAPFASRAEEDAEREEWFAEGCKNGLLLVSWPAPGKGEA